MPAEANAIFSLTFPASRQNNFPLLHLLALLLTQQAGLSYPSLLLFHACHLDPFSPHPHLAPLERMTRSRCPLYPPPPPCALGQQRGWSVWPCHTFVAAAAAAAGVKNSNGVYAAAGDANKNDDGAHAAGGVASYDVAHVGGEAGGGGGARAAAGVANRAGAGGAHSAPGVA
eukprot:scaffold8292_cov21-Tisochrysis_lutea.AAC.1